jgi:cation:H+ antiporter
VSTRSGASASLLPLIGALLLPLPWIVLAPQGFHLSPLLVVALAGGAILGAAFLLSWAAELAQLDVSQALALALLALIAVLPEYAVDAVFAFQAGRDPVVAQAGYAVANMTGANRLLIGLGWSSVVLLAWWRHGARRVVLDRSQALELSVLLAATAYALFVPFKGELNVLDTVVLLALFGAYAWATARVPTAEPELTGPAAALGRLPRGRRRAVTAALFVVAAYAIFVAAEPFAHGLVDTGRAFGIDEFLLVQWLAPLASEAPEFIVALLFVWRGQAAAGLRTLVSSKVNQWTLLIATLPLVFSLGAGTLGAMPLVARQQHELWLTAAQSLFAVVLISRFAMGRWEALVLLVPFVAQLALPPTIGGFDVRMAFTAGYLVVGLGMLLDPERRRALRRWPRQVRETLRRPLGPRGVPPAAEIGRGGGVDVARQQTAGASPSRHPR